EVTSAIRASENQWLASVNFPVFGRVRQSRLAQATRTSAGHARHGGPGAMQRMGYDGAQPPGSPQRCPRARLAGRRGSPRRLLGRHRGHGLPCPLARPGRKTRRALAGLVMGLLMLAGCVTPPVSPRVAVLPAPGKPVEEFEADEGACRLDAAQQAGLAQPQIVEQRALRSAVLGPLLGAVVGAAAGATLGAAAGHAELGATTGAGAGLVLGTGVGAHAGSGDGAAGRLQGRYDLAYQQCMYAKGNQVPGLPGLAPPQPPTVPPPR